MENVILTPAQPKGDGMTELKILTWTKPANAMSTEISKNGRRKSIVNLKQVDKEPLRNALAFFDLNGDGKIDFSELQTIVHWYSIWKYSSFGLCMAIMLLVWSTFGLTIWAINLTKDYTVTDGVLTGGNEVVKMSVASTYIPLSWATLLDRRHLDSLDSLTIDVAQGSRKFSAGVYHVKVASYVHSNVTYLKLFGTDGSRVWVNSGTVVLHHPDADEAIMVCGAAACNTLAVDVKPEYLQQLVQRSDVLLSSAQDFELPSTVDGVAINKADGNGATCLAAYSKFRGHHERLRKAHIKRHYGGGRADEQDWRRIYEDEAKLKGPTLHWSGGRVVETIKGAEGNLNNPGQAIEDEKYPEYAQVYPVEFPVHSTGTADLEESFAFAATQLQQDRLFQGVAGGGFTSLKNNGIQQANALQETYPYGQYVIQSSGPLSGLSVPADVQSSSLTDF